MGNSIKLFEHLPDDAILWVYTTDREMGATDREEVLSRVREFISTWTSHERPVVAETTFLNNRFLLVGAHIPGGDVSGCGIDKLIHQLAALESKMAFSWVDSLSVVYRGDDHAIKSLPRPDFRQLVRKGEVTQDTHVFDTSIHSVGDLRSGGLERSAKDTWHARIFDMGVIIDA